MQYTAGGFIRLMKGLDARRIQGSFSILAVSKATSFPPSRDRDRNGKCRHAEIENSNAKTEVKNAKTYIHPKI